MWGELTNNFDAYYGVTLSDNRTACLRKLDHIERNVHHRSANRAQSSTESVTPDVDELVTRRSPSDIKDAQWVELQSFLTIPSESEGSISNILTKARAVAMRHTNQFNHDE